MILSFGKIINQLNVNSLITGLNFQNRNEYIDFYYALLNKDSNSIFITLDNKKIDLNKESYFLESLFSFNLNEKTNLKFLYKNTEASLTEEEKEEFAKINELISSFINGLYPENKLDTIFSDSIELTDLLSLFKYRYLNECSNIVEYFCSVLKMISMLGKNKVIFLNNILKLFTDEEMKMIDEELRHLDLFVIDVNYRKSANLSFDDMKSFTIDENLFCY